MQILQLLQTAADEDEYTDISRSRRRLRHLAVDDRCLWSLFDSLELSCSGPPHALACGPSTTATNYKLSIQNQSSL